MAAATIGRLQILLHADARQFDKALTRTQRTLRKFSRQAEAMSRTVAIAGVATIGVLTKIAADAEETQSKFEAVFKEQAEGVEKWVDTLSRAVGRSKIDLRDYAASLQDTFVPMGFARKEAAALATQLVALGIDMASFSNKADADALRDLQSAIVGNHETVRKYGIIITEAALKQELLRMGIQKSANEVTTLEKVQARLNLIMAGTVDAQGDAERTAGSFSNQLKALKGEAKDMAAELGTALLPTMGELVSDARDVVKWLSKWSKLNPGLTSGIAKMAVSVTALSVVVLGLAKGAKALAVALGAIKKLGVLLSPLGAIVGVGALGLGGAIEAKRLERRRIAWEHRRRLEHNEMVRLRFPDQFPPRPTAGDLGGGAGAAVAPARGFSISDEVAASVRAATESSILEYEFEMARNIRLMREHNDGMAALARSFRNQAAVEGLEGFTRQVRVILDDLREARRQYKDQPKVIAAVTALASVRLRRAEHDEALRRAAERTQGPGMGREVTTVGSFRNLAEVARLGAGGRSEAEILDIIAKNSKRTADAVVRIDQQGGLR